MKYKVQYQAKHPSPVSVCTTSVDEIFSIVLDLPEDGEKAKAAAIEAAPAGYEFVGMDSVL